LIAVIDQILLRGLKLESRFDVVFPFRPVKDVGSLKEVIDFVLAEWARTVAEEAIGKRNVREALVQKTGETVLLIPVL